LLPNDVPTCPHCGSESFEPGGSRIGPGLSQQGFTCTQCKAAVALIGHRAGAILTYMARDACTEVQPHPDYPDHGSTWQYPEAYTTWVDKVLFPTWRDREDKLEALKTERWDKWLAEVFYVQFPELKGFIPADYAERGSPSPFTDTTISYPDSTPEAKALYDGMFGKDRGCTAEAFGELPATLNGPVYPPKCPEMEGVVVLFRFEDRWEYVDPEVSATLGVPEDPILVRNREFFDDVFAQVRANIEQPLCPVAKTKNRYGGLEPWYTFQLGNAVIVTGWRKRVVRIGVELETGFPTEDIRALAVDRDKVTYTASGPLINRSAEDLEKALRESESDLSDKLVNDMVTHHRETHPDGEMARDGGYNDERETAMKLIVHAWGKEKTVEYLTTLCRAVLIAQGIA
jgi:hypothetical protein